MTNLLYLAGAVTGLGAIYSLVRIFDLYMKQSKQIGVVFFCRFKVEKVRKKKKQATSAYDQKHLQSQDPDEKISASNIPLG